MKRSDEFGFGTQIRKSPYFDAKSTPDKPE